MATNPYNDSTLTLTRRNRYFKAAPDVTAVIRSHNYEDDGISFNRLNDTAPQTWELGYTLEVRRNLDIDEAADFDAHFAAHWTDTPFLFIDKDGTSHAVYYVSFTPSHDAHKYWIQYRNAVLIEYPGGPGVGDLPDETPPTVPTLTMSHTSSSITGTWTESTDEGSGLSHYLVRMTRGT